jgi:carbonic anhydrase
MKLFTDEVIRDLLASSLKTATLDAHGWRDSGEGEGSTEGEFINWLTFNDEAASVVEDVRRIRNHALVPRDITIHGFVYDVHSGRLLEVEEANEIGRAEVSMRTAGS